MTRTVIVLFSLHVVTSGGVIIARAPWGSRPPNTSVRRRAAS